MHLSGFFQFPVHMFSRVFYPVKVPEKYAPIAAEKSGADWSGGGVLGQVRSWSGVLTQAGQETFGQPRIA